VRPLTLRLQAFGSYAGVLDIDFARLGRHGVFSITGPTGAGKSTIFDAIVYALYDDLPGFRTDSHIRSQYADDAVPTSVVLTFEADGAEWVVERSPSQPRPRKRGGGPPVTDESRVVLNQVGADGGGTTRKSVVADELVRLVGLTKAQFEQVVLIPQGKFEEVLKADTKDRAALLGRLFPVDVFQRTTDALKEVAATRKAEYEGLRSSSSALIEQMRSDIVDAFARAPEGISVPDADDPSLSPEGFDPAALDIHRAALGELTATVAKAREEARATLEEARSRRKAAEDLVQRWVQWQADQATARDFPAEIAVDAATLADLDRARVVARMGATLGHWRSATDALDRARSDEDALRAATERAWVDGYDRGALARGADAAVLAARIAGDAERLESADGVHADLVRRAGELAADEAALAGRTDAVAENGSAVEAIDGRLATTRIELDEATARGLGRAEVELRIRGLEQDLAAAARRAAALAEVDRLTVAEAGAVADEAEAAARVIELRTAWRAGLAGRLAADLVDGEPCPTCGAIEHPAPAHAPVDAPTDADLQVAEDALRRAAEASHALRVELAAARATVEATGDGGPPDPTALHADLEAARSARDAAVAAEGDALRLRRVLDDLTRDRIERQATATSESEALLVDRAALGSRRQQWERERDAFVEAHGELASTAPAAAARRTLAEVVGRLARTLETAQELRSAVEQDVVSLGPTLVEFDEDDPAALERWARPTEVIDREARAVADREERRRSVESRLRSYAEDGGPIERPDTAPLIELERTADARHDDLVGRHAVVAAHLDAIDAARIELSQQAGELDRARAGAEEADTLYSACAGLGGGPVGVRVSLHNWVLAYYLRQVLAQANVRLDTMTGGRFALELDRESSDGRKASGLDLSVLDAETGQRRPATTLSGGETFMAALSLALGLADVVSAGSNYRIGALFVDEGFGSLDGESLDTVVDVLRSLQDGGRMVGVISHVEALQNALPHGITIASTTRGSEATIHYPEW